MAMKDEIYITAKFSTRCMCGRRVHAGERIGYDKVDRLTVGCRSCDINLGREYPAPDQGESAGPFMEEDWNLFHE